MSLYVCDSMSSGYLMGVVATVNMSAVFCMADCSSYYSVENNHMIPLLND